MDQTATFGEIVRERRRLRDLTQAELGRRVGCATVTIRKIEAGTLRPSSQIAELLAKALDVQADERVAFVHLARARLEDTPELTPIPTPPPAPEEIGEADLSGRSIRGYELGERLGAGGHGAVYQAVQPFVQRDVAIKIILPQLANRPEFIRRFEAEAQLVAQLEHPYIVPLYDYWREPGAAYLVMRLMRGGNLLTLIREGPLPLDSTVKLAGQIGAALEKAHQSGVVHRDLKPANILLDEEKNAYLADFGIAKHLDDHEPSGKDQVEMLVGTPAYLTPEQIRSEPLGPQTDVYGLGLLLYEMLTGRSAFQGPTPADFLAQQLNQPVPAVSASRTGVPLEVDSVITRATAKEPLLRYPDVMSLLQDLTIALEIAGTLAPAASKPAPQSERPNPYKGLRPFSEADATTFFGRDTFVQELLGRLGETHDLARFLAVIGPSGSGKSSVVNAGLIPAIRRGGLPGSEQWFVTGFSPGNRPMAELERALGRVAIEQPHQIPAHLYEDARGLTRLVNRLLPADDETELLLVVDQFEELFTLAGAAARDQFLDSLLTAVLDESSRIRVVITLRADFIDRALEYVDFGDLVRRRAEFLLPLSFDEVEEVIVKPAAISGLRIEPGLEARIARDLGNQPGALPLLQYALSELFEKRRQDALTWSAYEEIGGVEGALGRRAEELYQSLPAEGQTLAQRLFLRLVTFSDGDEFTRRRVRRAELMSLSNGREAEGEEQTSVTAGILDVFGPARLLTFDHDPETRAPTVEVAHEALLSHWPRLRGWLDESREDLRMQGQLGAAAAEWDRAGRDDSFLLRGSRLDHYSGWVAGSALGLSRLEQELLDASVASRDHRLALEEARRQQELLTAQELAASEKARAEEQSQAAQRQRRRAVYLAGALIVAVGLAAIALILGQQASQNASLASTREAEAIVVAAQRAAAQQQAESERQRADVERDNAVNAQATAETEALSRATAEAAAIEERQATEEQARLTRSRELALAALNSLGEDAERSILLALEALSTARTQEAEQVLHQAVQADQLQLRMQKGLQASQVGYSPDGAKLVNITWSEGEQASTATVWDALSGQEVFTLAPAYSVEQFVFSPDGSQIATVGVSEAGPPPVVVWDAATGQELSALDLIPDGPATCDWGITPGFYAVAMAAGGELLVTVYCAGGLPELAIWDVASGDRLLTVADYDPPGWRPVVAVSPDGQLLAANTAGGSVSLFDITSGELQLALQHGPGEVADLAFSPDGERLATAGLDGTAVIWDVASGESLLTIVSESPEVWAARFSPDGRLLATGDPDGVAKLWDATNGRLVDSFVGADDRIMRIAFSPNGDQLATADLSGATLVWSLNPVGEFFSQSGISGFEKVLVSPDGRTVAASDVEGGVSLWQLETGRQMAAWQAHDGVIEGLAFSPDGDMLATGGAGGLVKMWSVDGNELLWSHDEHQEYIGHLVFSPDGHELATVSTDGMLGVWESVSGRSVYTVSLEAPLSGVAYDPTGERLAVTQWSPAVATILEAATGEELLTFHEESFVDGATEGVFSPDGSRLAVSSFGGIVAIFDSQTGEQISNINAHNAPIWGLAFSPDGTVLATGSVDGTAKLWDVESGRLLVIPAEQDGPVAGLAFTQDGDGLLTAGYDHTVRGYILPLDQLVALAQSRLTRTFTAEECRQYLIDPCPAGE